MRITVRQASLAFALAGLIGLASARPASAQMLQLDLTATFTTGTTPANAGGSASGSVVLDESSATATAAIDTTALGDFPATHFVDITVTPVGLILESQPGVSFDNAAPGAELLLVEIIAPEPFGFYALVADELCPAGGSACDFTNGGGVGRSGPGLILATAIPEPAAPIVLAASVAGLAMVRRRKADR